MVKAPDQDTNVFVNRWTVGDAKAFIGNWCFEAEYDFAASTLLIGQGTYTKSFTNGSSLTAYFGRQLTAAGELTPGPDGLRTEWWHEVHMPYTVFTDGVGVSYSRGAFAAYAVRGSELSLGATFQGAQALWQENLATTVAYDGQWNKVINPFLGVTFFNEGGENQYSMMNTINVTKTLGLYYGGDFGRIEEGRIGGCWDIHPNLRLKGAYSVKAEKTFFEFVCHF